MPAPVTAIGFPHRPVMIGSEIYRRSRYARGHPLAIPRVFPVIDLARTLGWLGPETYIDSPVATPAMLGRFHDPGYIAAVQQAERDGRLPEEMRRRYNIGRGGNPVFAEVFRRPATAAGAGMLAGARLAAVPAGVIHSPAGGTHHGRPAMAWGFCFFNDPVLAILAMLDGGLSRVLYVDLDAHHGDGVQDAFHDDERVFTLSVHETGRWPGTGAVDDRAGGQARNLPVPAGFNDSELAAVIAHAVLPLGRRFAPEAVIIQAGADCLADDPQSRLELSNAALRTAVRDVAALAPRVLVTGGGGYNPWSTARAWTGIWADLNGYRIPARLPHRAQAVLRSLEWTHSRGRRPPEHWFSTLADPPSPGPVRAEIRTIISEVMR